MKFKVLKSKFPLYTDRLKISVLGKRDIDRYLYELKQPYYTEYLDNQSIIGMNSFEARLKLASLIATYSTPCEFKYEFRLLIRDKVTNEVYGGVTLNPLKDGEMEIAYWLLPMHNGNGYCTEAIKRIIKFISDNFKDCKYITLEIQNKNSKSIRLAERCSFSLCDKKQGKFGLNLIYKFDLMEYRAKVGD